LVKDLIKEKGINATEHAVLARDLTLEGEDDHGQRQLKVDLAFPKVGGPQW
jgi:hypothetical protein